MRLTGDSALWDRAALSSRGLWVTGEGVVIRVEKMTDSHLRRAYNQRVRWAVAEEAAAADYNSRYADKDWFTPMLEEDEESAALLEMLRAEVVRRTKEGAWEE